MAIFPAAGAQPFHAGLLQALVAIWSWFETARCFTGRMAVPCYGGLWRFVGGAAFSGGRCFALRGLLMKRDDLLRALLRPRDSRRA